MGSMYNRFFSTLSHYPVSSMTQISLNLGLSKIYKTHSETTRLVRPPEARKVPYLERTWMTDHCLTHTGASSSTEDGWGFLECLGPYTRLLVLSA